MRRGNPPRARGRRNTTGSTVARSAAGNRPRRTRRSGRPSRPSTPRRPRCLSLSAGARAPIPRRALRDDRRRTRSHEPARAAYERPARSSRRPTRPPRRGSRWRGAPSFGNAPSKRRCTRESELGATERNPPRHSTDSRRDAIGREPMNRRFDPRETLSRHRLHANS